MSVEPRDDDRLVEEAWSAVAPAYEEYWSPRLRPFIERAIAAFAPAAAGPLAIPGCGPGDEALLLAERYPERSILATDVSEEMIARARRRASARGKGMVLVTAGRAEDLSSQLRQAAGVFSSFLLHLLPDPVLALADWSLALRLEGTVAAVFFPRPGPAESYGKLAAIIEARTGARRPPWEETALAALPRLGLDLARDDELRCDFPHGSPEECFEKLVAAGPLAVLGRRAGRQLLHACGAEWLKDHGLVPAPGGCGWIQKARARLWVLRKTTYSQVDH